jgi:hypothetical protein
MDAPTAAELLTEPVVRQALEEDWSDALPNDPVLRHEESVWIFVDIETGAVSVRRAAAGAQAILDLRSPPPVPGAAVVATFHTHPNPTLEGWEPGPMQSMRTAEPLSPNGMSCRPETDS